MKLHQKYKQQIISLKGLYRKNERGYRLKPKQLYKFDKVLYQFFETGTSERTLMGLD